MVLRVATDNHHSRCVAVPSRLLAHPSPTKPLHGFRVTVKGMSEIQGLQISLGSRPYLDLYPLAKTTAPAIQALTDAGVHVLGITSKMCSTVLLQQPTQCIDFAAPFNLRADGY